MPDYRIEVSPNNRAGCTDGVCKKAASKCLKGSLRFGTWTKIMDHESFKWKHWGCVSGEQMAHVKELCQRGDGTFDFDAFDGYDELGDHPDLQAKIRKAIEQGHIDPEDFNGDPWMNKPGQRGIRGKKPKDWDDGEEAEEEEAPAKGKKRSRKSAAADEQEDEEKPKAKRTKKAAVKAEPEDEDEKPKPKAKRGKAAAAAVKAESEEDEKPKPKAKRGARKSTVKEESDSAMDHEEDEAPKPKRGAGKKAAPKKAKVEESEEAPEAEAEEEEEEEEEEAPAPKKGRAAPKGGKKAAPAAEKPTSTRASRSRK
ncbi:zf-PARP-domain-containing protein [Colletotrichum zoysiae]|uniref:Zf-PARP-domain-containing protein n=1 Tax=Colletotrichum zoysiae TaxID=1216348 RepID=A0AAD9HLK8_9PEZI|nr:zf-PARP-domain-containing protein [Colletotrichum zoysiae]